MDELSRELDRLLRGDAPERDEGDEGPAPEERLEILVAVLRDLLVERGLVSDDELVRRCRELAGDEEEAS